jgi:hypothetical protein
VSFSRSPDGAKRNPGYHRAREDRTALGASAHAC